MKHEIIQALEYCIKREKIPCKNRKCPYFKKTRTYEDCQNLLYENVLKYIVGNPPILHIDGREVMRLAGVKPSTNAETTGLRPCYVGESARKALFHRWERKQTASPLGGMLEFTVALVEFENGIIETRNPQHIRFADSAGLFKQFAFEEEREAKT